MRKSAVALPLFLFSIALAQTPTELIGPFITENPGFIIAILVGAVSYVGLDRAFGWRGSGYASMLAFVIGFVTFLSLTFVSPVQSGFQGLYLPASTGFSSAVGIELLPVLGVGVVLVIVAIALSKLAGGKRSGQGTSWKLMSFIVGLVMIVIMSIINAFINMPSITTVVTALGFLLILFSILGAAWDSSGMMKGDVKDMYKGGKLAGKKLYNWAKKRKKRADKFLDKQFFEQIEKNKDDVDKLDEGAQRLVAAINTIINAVTGIEKKRMEPAATQHNYIDPIFTKKEQIYMIEQGYLASLHDVLFEKSLLYGLEDIKETLNAILEYVQKSYSTAAMTHALGADTRFQALVGGANVDAILKGLNLNSQKVKKLTDQMEFYLNQAKNALALMKKYLANGKAEHDQQISNDWKDLTNDATRITRMTNLKRSLEREREHIIKVREEIEKVKLFTGITHKESWKQLTELYHWILEKMEILTKIQEAKNVASAGSFTHFEKLFKDIKEPKKKSKFLDKFKRPKADEIKNYRGDAEGHLKIIKELNAKDITSVNKWKDESEIIKKIRDRFVALPTADLNNLITLLRHKGKPALVTGIQTALNDSVARCSSVLPILGVSGTGWFDKMFSVLGNLASDTDKLKNIFDGKQPDGSPAPPGYTPILAGAGLNSIHLKNDLKIVSERIGIALLSFIDAFEYLDEAEKIIKEAKKHVT